MRTFASLCICLALLGCASGTTPVVTATAAVALSNTSYSFGENLVGSTLTQTVVTVTNYGTGTLTLQPTLSGDASYAIVAAQSCGAHLAPGASCAETLTYTPTAVSAATPQTAVLKLGLSGVVAGTPETVSVSGVAAVLAAGTVSPTHNVQVAQYTLTLPYPGTVTVNFGTDTKYGRSTWSQSTAVAGGQVSVLVAGMIANTMYHMQATVAFNNGLSAKDIDHTFTSGDSPLKPYLKILTPATSDTQSGVEQLTFSFPTGGLSVGDLQGNLLWSYALPNDPADFIGGAKLLPNGHFLISIGQQPSSPVTTPATGPNLITVIREIDLAGNTVRELSAADLSYSLQQAGYNLSLLEFHHDITPLPNGHWLVLANVIKTFTNLSGYPGTTNVLGDVIVDVDQNQNPVWVWNEFDHLDVNRHPLEFPDWTHTNAVVYSPSDGNLVVSMRHQNWVVKVDYRDGTGAGDILWRLGEGGDFKLVGGVDPTDWPYAQHYPAFVSPNSSGVFSLALMDNGDNRLFPSGEVCGTPGAPACYSTVPIYQIDETAKTATLTSHQVLPPALYNTFGGSVGMMANGNLEYDLCGVNYYSYIYEVTLTGTPKVVWELETINAPVYRGTRIPSLYPGVQW